jgi:uroporphyrin-III C-methyltransferase/precorrin-2 dehydrogenase/sirohydrochlorin ferrochelatase
MPDRPAGAVFASEAPVRSENELLPIFLKLAGRPVLVVGGGPVAASKLAGLVPTGARLTVVAPAIVDAIRQTGATLKERPFAAADLDGQWLVVAAATPEVNREVAEAAEGRHVFVNAVDDPSNASAYLGGVLRRDGLTVAISTSGRAPALAGLIREGLDALLPADLDEWFRRADELKREWRTQDVPMEARRPQLLDALVRLHRDRAARVTAGEPRS